VTGRLEVRVDLCFAADVPDFGRVTGELTGSGQDLTLSLSDPVFFAGRRDAKRIRGRSRASVLPGAELLPPGTLHPLVPTLRRRAPAPVTTTHDPGHGGNPSLVLPARREHGAATGQVVFPLRARTSLGSDPGCDVCLAGLPPVQAVVVHDEDDELVLVDQVGAGTTRVNGEQVERKVLRTGHRIELGSWTFVYSRAEYADHGRPFGGRVGGELGHQKPQPGRHRLADGAQDRRR
jgi:hypothetical protein